MIGRVLTVKNLLLQPQNEMLIAMGSVPQFCNMQQKLLRAYIKNISTTALCNTSFIQTFFPLNAGVSQVLLKQYMTDGSNSISR